jgi:hypothetical protein
MSIKAKIAAGAATFALAGGGLAAAGTLTASAATPSCGSNCTQLFAHKYWPQYVGDVYQSRAAAGQPVILFQASNTDQAEDFTVSFLGSVNSFYRHYGLVSAAFAHTYGQLPAVEIEYSPYGLTSNFCLSTAPGKAAVSGGKVSLQACGQYSSSLFAADFRDGVRDRHSEIGGDIPLISGATNSFSNPEVLTYPAGNPTDLPRPQLEVDPQSSYSGGAKFDSQLWGFQGSPVHGAVPPPPP